MYLVSILIPVYNSEKWLAETLASAISQSWQNKEIIVVNDGSTDNSLAIALSFESSIVKVIHQENRGASAARNRALQEAQGDFIQYLDADDLLAADKIERQVEILSKEENFSCVAAGEWGRFFNSPTEASFIPELFWQDMSPVDWFISCWGEGGMMQPAVWLIPRAIAQVAGYWNETLTLNDDGEYFCRVILASQGVKFCHGAKSYYRSGVEHSLSSSISRKAWESAFTACELCSNHLLAKEDSPRTRQACANAYQRIVYDVYPDLVDLAQQAEAKVRSHGGSNMLTPGGFVFQLLSKVVGWKQAKITQKFIYSYLKR
ncbi:MAG TPA: glycosyltransferase family 2 protein [Oculatellaceae cyanobacterium]|jgi:glycosyltransferase involved in cell wall biosynthesis